MASIVDGSNGHFYASAVLTTSVEQYPAREPFSRSASQERSRFYGIQKFIKFSLNLHTHNCFAIHFNTFPIYAIL
jgi:hypothetical protein